LERAPVRFWVSLRSQSRAWVLSLLRAQLLLQPFRKRRQSGRAQGWLRVVHGVSDEDAAYYEGQINSGGTFLSVDTDEAGISAETVRDILYGNGGHSASRARVGAA
jgi:hypothetical protein